MSKTMFCIFNKCLKGIH